tara:strand:+ start:543 stop:731 length:189 start_codon:yes stop_codon:yes gene_type:complete
MRIKSTEVQVGDLLCRGYRGTMRVAKIVYRDGWIMFYNSNGDAELRKPNGISTISPFGQQVK